MLLTAACGGSGSGSFDEVAASMEGIYRIGAYSRNAAACAPGGESLPIADSHALVVRQNVLGFSALTALSCASPADCRDTLGRLERGELFAVDFSCTATALGADGTLTGTGANSGFGDGAVCREGAVTATTFALAGDQLRIEMAITIADDYPAEREGFCTTDAAVQAAEGNICSQLELLTATFVDEL